MEAELGAQKKAYWLLGGPAANQSQIFSLPPSVVWYAKAMSLNSISSAVEHAAICPTDMPATVGKCTDICSKNREYA